MSRKRRLVDKINEEFEKLVGDKQQRQYSQYMRAINNDVVDEMPKNKKQLRKIINRHQLNPNTSIKMFSVMNGVQNLLLNPPTRESRKKLKPLEGLMRVYNVNNPKSFANAMYQMTTGQKQSDRNKRFRPLLLSYYDGFTENIETLEQQAQRAMKRAELEMQSTLFADMEELRRERLPITQVKKRLLDKYNDPKRIRRALDTELHEQAERVKLEQSKFMGYTHKKWNTQRDERVRRTKFHNQVANKVIPVDSQFKGGGIKADYPGDIDLPVGERINCRCYITYHNKPQAVPTSAPIIAPPRRRTSAQATPSVRKRTKGFKVGNNKQETIKNIQKTYNNVKLNNSFQNLNENVVKNSLNGLGDFMDGYTVFDEFKLQMRGTLSAFNKKGQHQVLGFGYTIPNVPKNYDISDSVINFHKFRFDNEKSVISELRQEIANGFKMQVDEGKETRYTAEHEFGHHIQIVVLTEKDYIKNVKSAKLTTDRISEAWAIYNDKSNPVKLRNQQAKDIPRLYEKLKNDSATHYVNKALERLADKEGWDFNDNSVKVKKIKQYTSDYGLTKPVEIIAEHWVSYRLNTKKPNPLSVEIGNVMVETLEAIENGGN